MDFIREFNESLGMTVVMVTHERASGGALRQRMIFLADGKLVDDAINVLYPPTERRGGAQ